MGQNEGVLVVEDEPMIAEMLTNVLQDEGFRVTCVHSGSDAIEVASSAATPFAYLVTDINLGGDLDGFDVAAAVAARNDQATTILLTGDYARSHRSRLPINATILEKPCRPFELVNALRGKAVHSEYAN